VGGLSIWLKDTTKSTFVLRASLDKKDVTEQATWSSSNPQVLELDPRRPGIVGSGMQGGGVVTAQLGAEEDAWSIDVWDGVLTHLGPPDAHTPFHLVVGIECGLKIPIDSSPTNSYDGHELVVSADPSDVVQLLHTPPDWRLRTLRPGQVTIRAKYGHATAEQAYDAREEVLLLKDICVYNSNTKPHYVWIGDSVDVWAYLTNATERFIFDGSNVRWSSTNPNVLRVETYSGGVKMTGLAEGLVQVVAEWGSLRKTADVHVTEQPKIEWF
jgi:hypothetical protein